MEADRVLLDGLDSPSFQHGNCRCIRHMRMQHDLGVRRGTVGLAMNEKAVGSTGCAPSRTFPSASHIRMSELEFLPNAGHED